MKEGDLLPSAPGERKSSTAGGSCQTSAKHPACEIKQAAQFCTQYKCYIYKYIVGKSAFNHRIYLDCVQLDLGMTGNSHTHAERVFVFFFPFP